MQEQEEKARQERTAALMRRVASRFTNGVLVRVISAWAGWVSDEIRLRVAAKRFYAQMNNACVVRCWRSWIEYLDWCDYAKRLATRTLGRLANCKIGAAWAAWTELVERHHATLAAFEFTARKMLDLHRQRLTRGWMQWQLALTTLRVEAQQVGASVASHGCAGFG